MKPPSSLSQHSFTLSAFALSLSAFLSGCIIIPTPEFDSGNARSNITQASPAQIEPRFTTMEDVLLTFGEPDAVSADERKLAYRSEKVVALWIAGGGNSATGGTLNTDHYLLVEFDQDGRVRSRDISSRWLFRQTPDALLETKGWLGAGAASVSESNRISGPAYWFPDTDGFKGLSLSPAQYSRGYLALTANALEFRDRTQLGNTEPRWLVPYETLKECRQAKFVWGRRVVIRTRDNQFHSFTFLTPSGTMQDKKKTEAAYQLIQTQITRGDHPQTSQSRP
jgi:outer membrane protein assembly factor BamE (lipoprotein component of BamABCDE complex)